MPKQKDIMNKREIGTQYEQIATLFLKEQGYGIIQNNYRCRLGEIDIIATLDEYIIFIEVKYRKTKDYGYPREAVNFQKQQRIKKTAAYYLLSHKGYEVPCRFDVIEILEDQITHLVAAF